MSHKRRFLRRSKHVYTLDRLHSPSSLDTSATLSKAEYMASVASGEVEYRAWEIVSAIEVRLYGEAAVIRYRSRIDEEDTRCRN